MTNLKLRFLLAIAGVVLGVISTVWGATLLVLPAEVSIVLFYVILFLLILIFLGVLYVLFKSKNIILKLLIPVYLTSFVFVVYILIFLRGIFLNIRDTELMIGEIKNFNFFVLWIFFGLVFLSVVPLIVYFLNLIYQLTINRDRLTKNDKEAKAEILSQRMTGAYINNQPMIEFEVRVFPENETSYLTKFKQVIPLNVLHRLDVGNEVKVKVDVNNKKNLIIA